MSPPRPRLDYALTVGPLLLALLAFIRVLPAVSGEYETLHIRAPRDRSRRARTCRALAARQQDCGATPSAGALDASSRRPHETSASLIYTRLGVDADLVVPTGSPSRFVSLDVRHYRAPS